MEKRIKKLLIMHGNIVSFITEWLPTEAVKGWRKKEELMAMVDELNNYWDDNFTDKELLLLYSDTALNWKESESE